ncbi:MAG: adenosine deaminase [Alphaproteobacteria bacterium]
MNKLLPKLELHSHLEGVAPPILVKKLAERNGIELPNDLIGADGKFVWSDFLEFLGAYDKASSTIATPQDYRDVTYEYLMEIAGQGAIYAETFSSPDHAAQAGMDYNQHLEGIVQGIEDAQRDSGIIGRVIISCVRHLGADNAVAVARQMVENPHPCVVGFGMGGDEMRFTFKDFAPAFKLARDHGYAVTAHAGEVGGAENVKAAIDHLGVTRIGHGVRVVEDKIIMQQVIDQNIMLEVCPGSNIALGIFPDYESHSLPALLKAGVKISLSSDDPPYFDSSVGGEYARAQDFYGFDLKTMHKINRDTLDAAFCDAETKAALSKKLDHAESVL